MTGMLPENSVFDRQYLTNDNTRWKNGSEPNVNVAAIINWNGITDGAELIKEPNAKHYAIEWFGSISNRKELAQQLSPISYIRTGLSPPAHSLGDTSGRGK